MDREPINRVINDPVLAACTYRLQSFRNPLNRRIVKLINDSDQRAPILVTRSWVTGRHSRGCLI